MKTPVGLGFAFLALCFSLSFTTPDSGYKAGDKAEGFKLKNVDGKMVSLSDYGKAKGFIVIFTCNHCPFARAYEKRIMALDKKYGSKGYPVIAINPNDPADHPEDSFENMVKRANDKKYTFPYLIDQTQEVARKYGAMKTPHVYLLKKNGGELTVEYVGAIDDNSEDENEAKNKYVETAIAEIESGKSVSVKETKAVGCGIKYKK
jgi:peroxiredoxin